MSNDATVEVLHPVLTAAGWVYEGSARMPLADAQALEQRGQVAIVSVDGSPYVHGACCSGDGATHA
jgi:hypothetical protein